MPSDPAAWWPGDPDFRKATASSASPWAHPVRQPIRGVAFRRGRTGARRRGPAFAELDGISVRRRRHSRRPRSRRIARRSGVLKAVLGLSALLLLGLVAVLADAYYQSFQIYKNVEVVTPSLRQASTYLAKGQLAPGDPFRRADRAVRRATHGLENARFTFRLAGAIPLFGRPVHAIRHGVAAAGEVTSAALMTQRAVSDLLGDAARTPASVHATDTPLYRGGVVNVKLLESLSPKLDEVVAHLRAADREIRAIPTMFLVPRVAELKHQAITDSVRAIRLAQRMQAGARVLPPFLGADGKKTYLIALQNQANLRGTGGSLLAYGIVTVDRGRFQLVAGGSVNDIRVDPSSLPPDLPRRRIDVPMPPNVSWYIDHIPRSYPWMGTANFSPDFPAGALTWARMAAKATGLRIDGVIAMDQVAVARALGPREVRVPEYPGTIRGADLVDVVSHDQYLLPYRMQIEFPAQLVAAGWPKILDPSSLQTSLRTFGESLRQKRIQLWLSRRDLERELRGLGWDGGVHVRNGDYLYVADNNVAGNKVDYYGRVSMHYRVTIDPSGDADSTLEVTLTNESPEGLPWLIAGKSHRVGGYAINRALMLSLVPERARLVDALPETGLPDHAEAGAKVFARTVKVRAGRSVTMRLRYTIDRVVTPTAGGKLYRLTIQHQPMLDPAHLTVTVTLPEGTTVHTAPPGWTVKGNVLTLQTRLDHDLVQEIVF